MKAAIYFWLTQLAYKIVLRHDRKIKKWCKKYEEWADKWRAQYSTGGGRQ